MGLEGEGSGGGGEGEGSGGKGGGKLGLGAPLSTPSEIRCQSRGMCLYQVMMTLYFLNDVANDAESTQKSIITP